MTAVAGYFGCIAGIVTILTAVRIVLADNASAYRVIAFLLSFFHTAPFTGWAQSRSFGLHENVQVPVQ